MFKYRYLDVTNTQIQTEGIEGKQWDTFIADDADYDVFDMYRENAEDIECLEYTFGLNFTYIDSNGEAHFVFVERVVDD